MPLSAVILEQSPPPPPAVLIDLLQRQGIPKPVAQKLARQSGEIVWEHAEAEPAAALAGALSNCGHPARVVSQADVPPVTRPRRVPRLDLDEPRLGIFVGYGDEPVWFAWEQVLVLSAGVFKSEKIESRAEEVRNVEGMLVGMERRVKVELERRIVADLFADEGTELRHFRLQSHELNYSQTMGGTALQSWREKFTLVLARLALRSAQALISPQTEALLAAGLIAADCQVDPYFEDDERFAAHNRWLVLRHRLGLAG
ncbi:MAG: hypothetical protein SFU86_16050 [Pirellulaceae bacterium]|nr:hypothetical protein [Pirellulaceae bacterium]